VDIGKESVIRGADLTSLYGRQTGTDNSAKTETEHGERQKVSTGRNGTAAQMVEISSEAIDLANRQEALQLAKEIYADLPDTRQDVVAEVKAKLAAGFYESEGVQAELTDRLTSILKRL
jgi:hypothetical protein